MEYEYVTLSVCVEKEYATQVLRELIFPLIPELALIHILQPTESILEKITKQREKQLKLGYTPQHDSEHNCCGQLLQAAYALSVESRVSRLHLVPQGWNSDLWEKYCIKPREERLIISATWIIAEIERNLYNESNLTEKLCK